MMRRSGWVLGFGVLLLGAGVAVAQIRGGERLGMQLLPNAPYDGSFTFLRVRYGGGGFGRGGAPWAHDYPKAEFHFAKILTEVSLTRTYLGGGNVVDLDDPELFKFPIAYLVEPGFWRPSEEEVQGLRAYLQKGGFLIVDDFPDQQWYNFEAQLRRVMPALRLIQLDETHPIFDSFFRIESLEMYHPYIPGLKAEFWGLFEDNDPAGRMLALVNYNNDIGEYWEFSDIDWAPIELTNEAFKLGVNYIIYGMTH